MSSHHPHPGPRRAGPAPLQKVVTRHNGLQFHCVAIASLLESTALLHANALALLPALDAAARRWLEDEWGPAKAARGQRLRAYVEGTWGGFDWACAYAEFYEACRPRVMYGHGARRPAAVMLSHCAAAAQAAALYRGLGAYADDPELRHLMREAGADEAGNFDALRALFERLDHARPLSAFESYRTVVQAAQDARDGAVRLAFEHISRNWCERAPFPEMTYALFLERVAGVIERFLAPDIVQRALFRPWSRKPGAPAVGPAHLRRDGDAPAAVGRLAAAA